MIHVERTPLPYDLPDYILEDRLREWGRWGRTKAQQLHCASIEYLWDSAMWNGWRDKGIPRKVEGNAVERVAQVETVVCYVGLTHPRSRAILVAHYVRIANPRATARVLRINILDYDAMLWAARGRVAMCLQDFDEEGINAAYRESVRSSLVGKGVASTADS